MSPVLLDAYKAPRMEAVHSPSATGYVSATVAVPRFDSPGTYQEKRWDPCAVMLHCKTRVMIAALEASSPVRLHGPWAGPVRHRSPTWRYLPIARLSHAIGATREAD
jgi:hypothetical protein